MIKESTRNLLANLGLEVSLNKPLQRNTLRALQVPREEWEHRDKGYFMKLLGITVNEKTSPLLEGYPYAKKIAQNGKGIFSFDATGQLQLKIKGVSFFINFTDELYVINEVFVAGDYNLKTTENLVVVDIGLNIAATSLFFAQQKNVTRIYAYELFGPTFQVALKNLALNDASRILAFNVGLGKANAEKEIEYAQGSKARMGLQGLPKNEKFENVSREKVTIKDVAAEFMRIESLETGRRKLCKMDCEGSEFEIVDRLFESKMLGAMDIYIIEWHDQDPEVMMQQFLSSGFEVIQTKTENINTGLIYAFKRSRD